MISGRCVRGSDMTSGRCIRSKVIIDRRIRSEMIIERCIRGKMIIRGCIRSKRIIKRERVAFFADFDGHRGLELAKELVDGEEKRGRVHDERVLRDEFFWNLRTCLAAEDLLPLHIPLSLREGDMPYRRFDATNPAGENGATQRQIPLADDQLVETLVPDEPAGEVGAAGDGGEQLAEGTCDAVSGGRFLDGAADEEGNAADEVADGGRGDGLLRGREGGDVEGGEESLAEMATSFLRQLEERGDVGVGERGGM